MTWNLSFLQKNFAKWMLTKSTIENYPPNSFSSRDSKTVSSNMGSWWDCRLNYLTNQTAKFGIWQGPFNSQKSQSGGIYNPYSKSFCLQFWHSVCSTVWNSKAPLFCQKAPKKAPHNFLKKRHNFCQRRHNLNIFQRDLLKVSQKTLFLVFRAKFFKSSGLNTFWRAKKGARKNIRRHKTFQKRHSGAKAEFLFT